MLGRIELAIGSNQRMISYTDIVTVQHHAIMVDEHVFANYNARPMVAHKG